MDYVTLEQKRIRRIAERLWEAEPPNPLAAAYKHFRGDSVDDFCTDLQGIVAIIDESRGQMDRMDKILEGMSKIEDSNSILVLFRQRYPDGDLWSSGLLDTALIVDVEVEADSWVCPGCERHITEGQHYMTVAIRIGTRMPRGYQPAREMPDTELHARVHAPNCLVFWMADNELLKNVFG